MKSLEEVRKELNNYGADDSDIGLNESGFINALMNVLPEMNGLVDYTEEAIREELKTLENTPKGKSDSFYGGYIDGLQWVLS